MLTHTEEWWQRRILNSWWCHAKWNGSSYPEWNTKHNLDNLNNRVVADQYKNELDVKLWSLPNISDNKWKGMAQATNNTVVTVVRKKLKYRFHVNDKISRLSKQQLEMRL